MRTEDVCRIGTHMRQNGVHTRGRRAGLREHAWRVSGRFGGVGHRSDEMRSGRRVCVVVSEAPGLSVECGKSEESAKEVATDYAGGKQAPPAGAPGASPPLLPAPSPPPPCGPAVPTSTPSRRHADSAAVPAPASAISAIRAHPSRRPAGMTATLGRTPGSHPGRVCVLRPASSFCPASARALHCLSLSFPREGAWVPVCDAEF